MIQCQDHSIKMHADSLVNPPVKRHFEQARMLAAEVAQRTKAPCALVESVLRDGHRAASHPAQCPVGQQTTTNCSTLPYALRMRCPRMEALRTSAVLSEHTSLPTAVSSKFVPHKMAAIFAACGCSVVSIRCPAHCQAVPLIDLLLPALEQPSTCMGDDDCNVGAGAGACAHGRCRCAPGWGLWNCSFRNQVGSTQVLMSTEHRRFGEHGESSYHIYEFTYSYHTHSTHASFPNSVTHIYAACHLVPPC
jgi:hypothetical protein